MAVNEDLSSYSTTAASNTPAGTDAVGPDLDNHLRDTKRNVKLAYSHRRGPTSPDIVAGRIWNDTSASASSVSHLQFGDGVGNIYLFAIDESADKVYPYIGNKRVANALEGFLTQESTGSAVSSIGLAPGVGLKTATASFAIDIVGLTADASPDSADSVMTFDASASAHKKVTLANFFGSFDASQAEVEAASITDKFVPPGRMQNHPGVAKFCALITGSSGALVTGHNVTSTVRNSAGNYTVTIGTDFSSANWWPMVTIVENAVGGPISYTIQVTSKAAGSITIQTAESNDGDAIDVDQLSVIGFGDQ